MCSPSASLAVWSSAWIAGRASPDDVVDALTAWAPVQLVVAADGPTADATGLEWPSPGDTGAADLLRTIRTAATANAEVRVILPAPGDVRGTTAGTRFAAAAVVAGEGVLVGVAGSTGLGLVPVRESQDVLLWTAYSVEIPHYVPDSSLRETEYTIRETVRRAAETLSGLQTVPTTGGPADPRAMVAERLDIAHRHRYPPMPDRVVRLLDTVDRVAAILDVAAGTAPSDGTTSSSNSHRENTIRPLAASVRAARVVAFTSAIEDLLGRRAA